MPPPQRPGANDPWRPFSFGGADVLSIRKRGLILAAYLPHLLGLKPWRLAENQKLILDPSGCWITVPPRFSERQTPFHQQWRHRRGTANPAAAVRRRAGEQTAQTHRQPAFKFSFIQRGVNYNLGVQC